MMKKIWTAIAASIFGAFLVIPAGAEGYWVTQAEDAHIGTRALHPGDILSVSQLGQVEGTLTYRIVENDTFSEPVQAVLSLGLRKNQAPIAQDSALETYRDMEITGHLRVQDPEGAAMTYSVIRQPRRGIVTLNADGSFIYSPKKNKVGLDSFTYIAQDETGNSSREATVTVTIIRPTDDERYTDTAGNACAFAAEWMRSTGIFVGESLDGHLCFQPEQTVTQGELLAMAVRLLEIPVSEQSLPFSSDFPTWLKPYVTAAVRSGLTGRLPRTIEPAKPATLSQAEALLCFECSDFSSQTLTRGEAANLFLEVWKSNHGGRLKIL